jgi:hypothetical protein
VSLDTPDARIAWVKQVAAEFPGEFTFDVQATWTNQHGRAGVTVEGNELTVFLNSATRVVHSRQEAVEALRAIFADELVAVAALSGGTTVSLQLSPANDLGAGFGELGRRPSVDEVMVETWSRGLLEKE